MYLEGYKQAEIAARLNEQNDERGYTLTQQMVSYDLGQLIKEWRASGLMDINEAKAQELAKINHLEMVYWDAWHKSCEDAQTITRKSKGVIRKYEDGGGGFVSEQPAEVGQRTQGQVGDPRYLAGVQWCIDRRCKILGVDEATKLNIQGDANVTQEVRFDLSGLPAEILQLIAFSGDDSELAEVGET